MQEILSVEYNVAHQIISNMLNKGLISKAEFETIDKENIKHLSKTINLLVRQDRAIITTPGKDQG